MLPGPRSWELLRNIWFVIPLLCSLLSIFIFYPPWCPQILLGSRTTPTFPILALPWEDQLEQGALGVFFLLVWSCFCIFYNETKHSLPAVWGFPGGEGISEGGRIISARCGEPWLLLVPAKIHPCSEEWKWQQPLALSCSWARAEFSFVSCSTAPSLPPLPHSGLSFSIFHILCCLGTLEFHVGCG